MNGQPWQLEHMHPHRALAPIIVELLGPTACCPGPALTGPRHKLLPLHPHQWHVQLLYLEVGVRIIDIVPLNLKRHFKNSIAHQNPTPSCRVATAAVPPDIQIVEQPFISLLASASAWLGAPWRQWQCTDAQVTQRWSYPSRMAAASP